MTDHPNRTPPKNKRLVLLLAAFPQLSETFIVRQFLGLLARGWDVHVVCAHVDRDAWDQFPALAGDRTLKSRLHQSPPHRPRWLAALLLPLACLSCLAAAPGKTWRYLTKGGQRFGWGVFKRLYRDAPLVRLAPDIVHVEFGSLAVGRTELKDLLGVKLSVSFRGYDLNYIGLDQPGYYQAVWETVDGAHFLGEDLWVRAQQRGAPPNFPHSLIPPAIDLAQLPPPVARRDGSLGTPGRPLRILGVGRLHWKKGYEFTLQAVKLLVDRGLHCVYHIIGSGDYQAALYFARHQLGLEDTVEFLGSVPHRQVLEHLQWADVFLHGAVSEGFCNAVLEAQALGLPVVCSDADGLPENVAHGQTGFVVPRRDPLAMAEKLAVLAQDGGLRRSMGGAGRQRAAAHFRIEDQLDAFEAFYDAL